PLGIGEHGRLAGGSRNHKKNAPVVGQPAGQGGRPVEVEGPVRVEWRDHGGEDGAEAPRGAGHQDNISSFERSMPRVDSRSSCSSNHTVWYETISGRVNHSPSPAPTRARACAKRGP